jgi:hypothetical protein
MQKRLRLCLQNKLNHLHELGSHHMYICRNISFETIDVSRPVYKVLNAMHFPTFLSWRTLLSRKRSSQRFNLMRYSRKIVHNRWEVRYAPAVSHFPHITATKLSLSCWVSTPEILHLVRMAGHATCLHAPADSLSNHVRVTAWYRSWQSLSCSTNSLLLWYLKVDYHVHNPAPLYHVLSQWSRGIAPCIFNVGSTSRWSTLRSRLSTAGLRAHGTHWIRSWASPRIGLDIAEVKEKMPTPAGNGKPAVQRLA